MTLVTGSTTQFGQLEMRLMREIDAEGALLAIPRGKILDAP
jgi:hypothetical protein